MRSYSRQHPIILHSKHPLTKLLIHSEHLRPLHSGPTLLSTSLSRHVHIICGRNAIQSVTRTCVKCRRVAARPQNQLVGQLPKERITPDIVFSKVGLDYAGPLMLKLGSTCRAVLVKSYVCLRFVVCESSPLGTRF